MITHWSQPLVWMCLALLAILAIYIIARTIFRAWWVSWAEHYNKNKDLKDKENKNETNPS